SPPLPSASEREPTKACRPIAADWAPGIGSMATVRPLARRVRSAIGALLPPALAKCKQVNRHRDAGKQEPLDGVAQMIVGDDCRRWRRAGHQTRPRTFGDQPPSAHPV